jgi:hypothetical protein
MPLDDVPVSNSAWQVARASTPSDPPVPPGTPPVWPDPDTPQPIEEPPGPIPVPANDPPPPIVAWRTAA